MSLDLKMKILLVEDAGVMRKMEKKTLNTLGFQNILEAEDGEIAISQLEENPDVALIISDWNMPNKNGYDLLLWLRAHEHYSELPFMMATGRGEKKEIAKASEAGVSSFIAKPFNADELREKMEEALGLRTETDETEEFRPRVTEDGKIRLNVAHIQITDHLVLGVLKHLINTEKLTPQFFELETQCMPSWNPLAKALEKGTIDAACILAPIAMDLYSYGVPIKLVLYAHKNGSIFVRNKKGGVYKEPHADFFRHKSFYIPHFLSIHHMLAHMFFTGIGLNPGMPGEEHADVHFEVAPPIKMPEFIDANPQSSGYLVAEPLGTKAIAAGLAELQFLSSELWENHPCCIVAMRDEYIENYSEAVYEFTRMLVHAGKLIAQKPDIAAEIAVDFLDPDKKLGLRVPLLKNVLTEPLGIKTGDLYPSRQDLDRIQQYMHNKMGIGHIIDLDNFVDLQFANEACTDRVTSTLASVVHEDDNIALQILERDSQSDALLQQKALINKEGKYLMFSLDDQQFGIDILKIREIQRMMPVRTIPNSPPFVKGMINLRGSVIPIIDLRKIFNFENIEYGPKACIIVLEMYMRGNIMQAGIVVDDVSSVTDIKTTDIEEIQSFGLNFNTDYILAMAKKEDTLNILLDIDRVLNQDQTQLVNQVYQQIG